MKTLLRTAVATAILGYSSVSTAEIYLYSVDSMSVTELGYSPGFAAVASDINDLGEIVGTVYFNPQSPRAMLYRNGILTWVTDDLGVNASWAEGINNNSEIVGTYRDPDVADLSAFYWNDSASEMETLSGNVHDAWAMAINDAGKIAGIYVANPLCGGFAEMAVTWENGYAPYTALFCPAPGEGGLGIEDINESGTVVGHVYNYPDILARAFRWNGTKTTVPLPSGTCQSFGYGINESGAVAGRTEDCDGFTPRAFFWNGSSTTSVALGTLPGGNKSEAREVNDDRIVAGWSEHQFPVGLGLTTIRQRAFIWHAQFGMKALPIPAGYNASSTHCRANALSNRNPFNGFVRVVGYCINSSNIKRPMRWTIKVIKTALPIPPL